MLSIRDVPMYPQKYTKLILPISMATIYFLKSIFIKPQTILTRNAGVNGIAINRIKFVRDMFLNDFLYLFSKGVDYELESRAVESSPYGWRW